LSMQQSISQLGLLCHFPLRSDLLALCRRWRCLSRPRVFAFNPTSRIR
jgi:hypothetical protein